MSLAMPEGHVPSVLVLMATFNGARWVREQVLSIAAQEGVDAALLISDDNSTDDTLGEIAAAAADRIPFRVSSSASRGGSAARNFFRVIEAADASTYDYVALADQDDVWEPGKLARAARRLADGTCVGYSAAVRAFWPDGRKVLLSQRAHLTLADYLFEGAGQGCTFVFPARHFVRLQHWVATHRAHLDDLHYHDWALYAMSRAAGGRWIFDDWVCLQYRQHGGNDTGARSGRASISKRLDLIRSGWYSAQVFTVAQLCLSVSSDPSAVASDYLGRLRSARSSALGRLSLAVFLLRRGRRRWSDRLVLAWAAIGGYLRWPAEPAFATCGPIEAAPPPTDQERNS